MPVGTEYFVNLNKQRHCLRLNIGDYETETYFQSEGVKIVGGKEFYPLLLRFVKNGKRLVAVVPAEVKKETTKAWPFTFTNFHYDFEAMEKEAERIVLNA